MNTPILQAARGILQGIATDRERSKLDARQAEADQRARRAADLQYASALAGLAGTEGFSLEDPASRKPVQVPDVTPMVAPGIPSPMGVLSALGQREIKPQGMDLGEIEVGGQKRALVLDPNNTAAARQRREAEARNAAGATMLERIRQAHPDLIPEGVNYGALSEDDRKFLLGMVDNKTQHGYRAELQNDAQSHDFGITALRENRQDGRQERGHRQTLAEIQERARLERDGDGMTPAQRRDRINREAAGIAATLAQGALARNTPETQAGYIRSQLRQQFAGRLSEGEIQALALGALDSRRDQARQDAPKQTSAFGAGRTNPFGGAGSGQAAPAARKPLEERVQELKASGASKDQARAILRREGYQVP